MKRAAEKEWGRCKTLGDLKVGDKVRVNWHDGFREGEVSVASDKTEEVLKLKPVVRFDNGGRLQVDSAKWLQVWR